MEKREYGAFYDWEKGKEYSPEKLLRHEVYVYCPSREELKKYAEKYREYFIYEEPLLLSCDKKIMYGYSAEELDSLTILDSVEVYDNICIHSIEEENEYIVEIGKGLKKIVTIENAFGFHNIGFLVPDNDYFSEVDGILYDAEAKKLIAYPSGRTSCFDEIAVESERKYVQLPDSTEKICTGAFDMLLLPMTLVIPDSVKEIEVFSFCEEYDKGLYMSERDIKERKLVIPERFKEIVEKMWKNPYYSPGIICY